MPARKGPSLTSDSRFWVHRGHIPSRYSQKTLHAAQIVDRDYVRMQQVCGRSRLGPELFPKPRLTRDQSRIHDLEGARPSQAQVLCLEHPSHRAAAQHRVDPVLTDPASDQARFHVAL